MTCFSSVSLSSTEAPFCRRKAGEREKESAEDDGKVKKMRLPPFPSSHRPLRSCFFLIIAIFIGIPSGASVEKSGFVSLPFILYQIAFFGTKSSPT